MHVAILLAARGRLRAEVGLLITSIEERAERWRDVVKLGRTHLQDATPVTVGQESGRASLLRDALTDLEPPPTGCGPGHRGHRGRHRAELARRVRRGRRGAPERADR